jgi:putative methyltransferase (TIGR04325 family)
MSLPTCGADGRGPKNADEASRRVPLMKNRTPSPLWRCLRWAKDLYRYVTFAHGQFRGVYKTFGEAEAAVPHRKKLGYNHAELAREYQSEVQPRLDSSDYPILFHLQGAVKDGSKILDVGGNVGVHYLRYRKYLNKKKLKWVVWDVPEIAKAGRELCAEFGELEFISDIHGANDPGIDILLGYDSFQYFESPGIILRRLMDKSIRPAHILADGLPLYDGEQFVTLQNGGAIAYPQYVFNRAQFVQAIVDYGYRVADSWTDQRSRCVIPFHRERTVPAYSGFMFTQNREVNP